MVDESKLLVQLQKRQKNSINHAIEVYTPYLSTVLYNMVGNGLPKEDIEEIVSDVFVMLWKNAEYIDLKKVRCGHILPHQPEILHWRD